MDESSSEPGPSTTEKPDNFPETVEVTTAERPDFSVIWLHGLGADGHDFEPVVPMLGLPPSAAVRFVFPHADVRSVTLNGGTAMRAWYDITTISASRDQDEEGIEASARQVRALMRREVERGVPHERQVVAGFSQGGAMALHVALRFPHRLAGLIALSSYLLFPDRLGADRSEANADLPVFIGHGMQDPVVPFAMGQQTVKHLRALDYTIKARQYPIPHSVSPEELTEIGSWLARRMKGS